MTVFISGLALLCLSFLAHIALWRIRPPRRHIHALLLLFLFVPIAAVPWLPPLSLPQFFSLALFYLASALSYIVLFSAVEAQSPTLAIVSKIARKKSWDEAELSALFARGNELDERLELLERGGLISRVEETYRLTGSGFRYAALFEVAARIMGLGKGG